METQKMQRSNSQLICTSFRLPAYDFDFCVSCWDQQCPNLRKAGLFPNRSVHHHARTRSLSRYQAKQQSYKANLECKSGKDCYRQAYQIPRTGNAVEIKASVSVSDVYILPQTDLTRVVNTGVDIPIATAMANPIIVICWLRDACPVPSSCPTLVDKPRLRAYGNTYTKPVEDPQWMEVNLGHQFQDGVSKSRDRYWASDLPEQSKFLSHLHQGMQPCKYQYQ
ncbi:hypothetical protein AKJ16_DCAP06197 [Drosera capensis]